MVDPLGHQTIPPSPAEPIGQWDFALHPATSARTRCIHLASVNQSAQIRCIHPASMNQSVQIRCIHPASALFTSISVKTVSKRAGGHGGPPLRGVCNVRLTFKTKQPHIAMRGGMWSGWAASRTGQLSDTASQHPFGGWQGGHHPRWQYPPPQSEMITPAIGDGRPTWPPDVTAKPSRTEGSTGFRVTSGDLGTHAMHPPRKRESNNADRKQSIFETCGRTRRSAPTRRFVQ